MYGLSKLDFKNFWIWHNIFILRGEVVYMDYKTIDSATLKSWLEKDEAVLIDVREQGEYDEVNIPASTLVPLGKISIRALPSSDKKIVIHCLKGGRGQKACEALCAQSRELDLYNLAGGIEAWIDAGLPVHRKT